MPLAEKKLVARIREMARRHSRQGNLVLGIGDDCAALNFPVGHEVLVTSDLSLEGIHFRRDWHAPEVVGYRCLTRGLSDIAAMGGQPQAAFLSLALPRKLNQGWVDRFMGGFLKLAAEFKVPLAGGDTGQSPDGILADVIVVGSVPRGKAILRSGARVGDRVYVTGELGGSAEAIVKLTRGTKVKPREYPQHFRPCPRIKVGRYLREKRLASAMIDISDGVSTDLAHICEESARGAEIVAEAIPRARVGRNGSEVSLNLALHGGDDYELLFTSPPGKRIPSRIAEVPVTQIGVVTRLKRIILVEQSGVGRVLKPKGWEHFKR